MTRPGNGTAQTPHSSHLELEEDEALQYRTWRIQRCGWLLTAVVVLAGAAGLFGNGPLSRAHAAGHGVRVDYERFARVEAETRVCILVARPSREIVVVLPRSYANAVQLQSLEPQPASSRAGLAGLALRYEADGRGPFVAHLNLEPESSGLHRAHFIIDGQRVAVTQMVWP